MKSSPITVVALIALVHCIVNTDINSNELAWRQFIQDEKVYPSHKEEARRLGIFLANKRRVERHNPNASASFAMELNHMSDWTEEEFALINGARIVGNQLDEVSGVDLDWAVKSTRDMPLPEQFDWQCRRSRLLEGQELAPNMSSLVGLSEQELIDCSTSNHGCKGGWMSLALDDLVNVIGGIETEINYPYLGLASQCASDKGKFVPLKLKGFHMLPTKDEAALKETLVNYGPVAVVFEATLDFMTHKSGIYEDEQCVDYQPNHPVLIVGCGTDSQKGDFWIIKNSWGTEWAEEGYVRFKRGENMCGIANYGTIAIFE